MSVTLTAPMRNNLLSLQNTQNQIGITQNRLATGLRVSSAIDDPRNFFQAQAMNNRASDLSRRLDGMATGIQTLRAADEGIKAMTKVVESMAALVNDAQDNPSARADLMAEFNVLRTQLQDIANDSGFNGTNLLNGGTLNVRFNESSTGSSLSVSGVTWGGTSPPAGIAQAADWADSDATVAAGAMTASLNATETALNSMRTEATALGTNMTMIQVREDFTRGMINTLKAGADALTLANENEEAANLLALQTRQQLGIQALSLAAQSQQGILRLL